MAPPPVSRTGNVVSSYGARGGGQKTLPLNSSRHSGRPVRSVGAVRTMLVEHHPSQDEDCACSAVASSLFGEQICSGIAGRDSLAGTTCPLRAGYRKPPGSTENSNDRPDSHATQTPDRRKDILEGAAASGRTRAGDRDAITSGCGRIHRKKRRHPIDKTFRHGKSCDGPFQRNFRIRPKLVIGHRFQIVRTRKKALDFRIDAGKFFCQAVKFRMDALMGFGYPAGSIENKRLRRMEARKIRITARIIAQIHPKIDARITQTAPRLGKEAGRFRRHSSCPSRRTSCIKGVRSK